MKPSALRGCCGSPLVVVTILIFALSFKPLILPFLMDLQRSPLDERLGTLPILSPGELQKTYTGKRVLVVGGTRGVGLGTALAVAEAGAHVTVVGRSVKSGARTLERLRQVAPSGGENESIFSFVEGDIGSVAKANALVDRLEQHVVTQRQQQEPTTRGFDYLIVTAAVFPDWNQPQQQEDGIDKCFAIAVVGRYILYKNMGRYMRASSDGGDPVRVLNVLGSGEMPSYSLSRDLANGERNASNLFESILTFGNGNELMLKIIDSDPKLHLFSTRVSTHPGALKTDLHRGQGLLFDLIEKISVAIMGISIEECGIRQASILASPKLMEGQLSYVSSDMKGRLADPKLEALATTELPWLTDFLINVVDKQ